VPLVLRGYLRQVAIAIVAGIGAGILVAGAGGRLVMRLLAATAGDAAQGRLTEAEELVGEITLGGTIGFIVFVGVLVGAASGVGYLLLRRWLPRGPWSGPAFGALLLVTASPHLDPLRPENPDFDIVGPGWLAAVSFGALALLHGSSVAALAGRYSREVPLVRPAPRALLTHAPFLLLVPGLALLVPVIAGGGVALLATRSGRFLRVWSSRATDTAGRVVLALGALVALPWFVAALADIVGRGP
jgi:hypothetical protein